MAKALQLMTIIQIKFILILCGTLPPSNKVDMDSKEYWLRLAENKLLENEQYLFGNKKPKNIILFIGDGMGMSSITAARIHKGQMMNNNEENNGRGEETNLVFEKFPNIGLSKTYNTNRQVPDSAGTATALYTAIKTQFGVIGVDNELNDVTTILEWSLELKKRTGFVTTTTVTHATPAALYAKSINRNWECDSKIPKNFTHFKDIARQLVENYPGNEINVIMGGGGQGMGLVYERNFNETLAQNFGGSFEKICPRNDNRNLTNEWMMIKPSSKRKFVQNLSQLNEINPTRTDYILGLFASNHIPYNMVRNVTQTPSLVQMTETAIKILRDKSETGFFLMVEGGRIDHAHHQNYARIALDEVIEFEKAINRTIEIMDLDETLIIVTADHSHSLTISGYPLRGNDIFGYANKTNEHSPYETLSYATGPGFWEHRSYDNNNKSNGRRYDTWEKVELMTNRSLPNYRFMSAIPTNDSTHSGEDVPVYAIGPHSNLFRGVFEQNYIGFVMSFAICKGPAEKLCRNNKNLGISLAKDSFGATQFIIVFSLLLMHIIFT